MSSFSQFRAAWNEWKTAGLPTVPATWTMDPQPMIMKLPVRLELDGPMNLANTADRDYRTSSNDGADVYTAYRTGTVVLKAISRDNPNSPAELTLERARACLRRSDLHAILLAADISVRTVGPSVRYDVEVNGRAESVAACEVRFVWRFTDEIASSPDYGIIEQVELTQNLDAAYFVPEGSIASDELGDDLVSELSETLII